jgi:hypothetical protein
MAQPAKAQLISICDYSYNGFGGQMPALSSVGKNLVTVWADGGQGGNVSGGSINVTVNGRLTSNASFSVLVNSYPYTDEASCEAAVGKAVTCENTAGSSLRTAGFNDAWNGMIENGTFTCPPPVSGTGSQQTLVEKITYQTSGSLFIGNVAVQLYAGNTVTTLNNFSWEETTARQSVSGYVTCPSAVSAANSYEQTYKSTHQGIVIGSGAGSCP